MPFALFENDVQLSRAFATEAEVWDEAKEAGLVDNNAGIEQLEDHLTIRPCPADPAVPDRASAKV